MRAVLHERSLSQGAIAFERRVDEQMPVPVAQLLPALPEPVALPQSVECIETRLCEADEVKGKEPTPQIPTTSQSKLLTHVASIESERFTLEQAILPVGTGLSHELTWDGPGTWWEELGIPPTPSGDEASESSLLLTLMINSVGVKPHGWS